MLIKIEIKVLMVRCLEKEFVFEIKRSEEIPLVIDGSGQRIDEGEC